MPSTVRIVLSSRSAALQVSCRGTGTWFGMDGGSYRALGASGAGPWTLTQRSGTLAVNGQALPHAEVELQPGGGAFQLGDAAYRGRLRVKAAADGNLTASNLLPPQAYLRSVVGSEMFASWPLDALMAQAVAARTYMLFAIADKGYLNRMDMAYKGISAEHRAPTLAVDLTDGIVLTYGGRILPAYFHSTCGGHTASVKKVFGQDLIGPLTGVPCEWCEASPTYRWAARIPVRHIVAALKSKGIERLDSIEPLDTAPDGYARDILLNGEVRMDANAFRLAVSPAQVKSTRFDVTRDGDSYVFRGRGYGHGIGLCQWGAHGMAKAGRSWEEILLHYYPGAELRKVFPAAKGSGG